MVLSEKKFQFILKNKHDFLDVLEKEVHIFNEWIYQINLYKRNFLYKDYIKLTEFLKFANIKRKKLVLQLF